MKKLILGIETSCDETSIAIVEGEDKLLSNVVSSQIKIHEKYGGVMPEIASRLHVENINIVLDQALKEANVKLEDISAFAFTRGPGLIGALHVGAQAAKTLALTYNVPLIGVHHIAGHIYANKYIKEISYPCLALVVSGGHTELVYMKKELNFKVIGKTQDDAIGEAYDKVARVLGLTYPGGPQIDRLAKKGKPFYKLPIPHTKNPLDVSYSGLKTSVINIVHNIEQKGEKINVEDMCYAFQLRAIDLIIDKVILALKKYDDIKQVVVAGGVAANSYLREKLPLRVNKFNKQIDVVVPPMWCCTDNAAMITILASKLYEIKKFDDLSIGVDPNWSIEDALEII
ncbi:MAG: tRNA (adenosine(37)-N6)-threonylcarbamoyltransferase complex transferase subunit TsaD [Bacilli bacterium]|nr:tRNA (adenosine(37)-N6)-threonylcarbamoyltransferase complex transferase subunit TsaD [Bacilli bacterium]